MAIKNHYFESVLILKPQQMCEVLTKSIGFLTEWTISLPTGCPLGEVGVGATPGGGETEVGVLVVG